jgi:hypothetical protein
VEVAAVHLVEKTAQAVAAVVLVAAAVVLHLQAELLMVAAQATAAEQVSMPVLEIPTTEAAAAAVQLVQVEMLHQVFLERLEQERLIQ